MPNTRKNKIQVPSNSDAWNLVPDLTTMADTANPVVPVVNDAERDAIPSPGTGMVIARLDAHAGLQYWNGTAWIGVASLMPFGHMGKTNGFQSINPAATVVMTQAQELRGGMTFDDATDSLVVPIDGLYRCTAKLYTTGGGTGKCGLSVVTTPTRASGSHIQVYKHDGTDWYGTNTSTMNLVAGDKVNILASGTTSVSTWGTDGYNGAFLELEYIAPSATY